MLTTHFNEAILQYELIDQRIDAKIIYAKGGFKRTIYLNK